MAIVEDVISIDCECVRVHGLETNIANLRIIHAFNSRCTQEIEIPLARHVAEIESHLRIVGRHRPLRRMATVVIGHYAKRIAECEAVPRDVGADFYGVCRRERQRLRFSFGVSALQPDQLQEMCII